MIWKIKEGKITWLPGLASSDLPTSLPSGISIHLKQEIIGLDVQGLAGAIPLRNGDTLQIIPKVGQVNFLRLLFKAEGLQRDLEREYDDFVEYSVDFDENIDSIVARQLMVSAAEIMRFGPKQGRTKSRHTGLYAVGHLDATATALRIACHKSDPVVCTIKQKTVNIPENRVITEALTRAWPMLDDPDRSVYRKTFEKWKSRFPLSKNIEEDLELIEIGFASGSYGGPRGYYRKGLMLSQVILGSSGLGFGEATCVEGDAILLNTADIFEKYLRNVISEAYLDAGFLVTKSGIGVKSLYTDGSYALHPDIVISRDGRTLLIADAKYKVPTASDHYQMHTYLNANNIKTGLLLAPNFESKEVIIREFSTVEKVVVKEVYLPMDDLGITENFLGSLSNYFS